MVGFHGSVGRYCEAFIVAGCDVLAGARDLADERFYLLAIQETRVAVLDPEFHGDLDIWRWVMKKCLYLRGGHFGANKYDGAPSADSNLV